MNSELFVRLARVAAAEAIIQERQLAVAPSALYVVWQAKILDYWKLLLSTDVIRGVYVEVTFTGRTDELYVDVYEKRINVGFTQTGLRDISAWDAMRQPTPEEASDGFVEAKVSDADIARSHATPPVAATEAVSGYTSHGHRIAGVVQTGRPTSVARCGGPGLCTVCSRE